MRGSWLENLIVPPAPKNQHTGLGRSWVQVSPSALPPISLDLHSVLVESILEYGEGLCCRSRFGKRNSGYWDPIDRRLLQFDQGYSSRLPTISMS